MAKLSEIWNLVTGKQPNPLDQYYLRWLATNAIYPQFNAEFYLNAYTGNNDVFTVINKITEPASTIPIYQYDDNDEIYEGKMIARLNNPNPYQSRSELIEAAITYYYIFGNCYTACETLDNGLNAGFPARLDILPSQFMTINLGTMFDPVAGYSFYPMSGNAVSGNAIDYPKEKIYHWKEFNPDYSLAGGHLKGMSRLRPLLKSVVGSGDAYNSLVKAFQNQGAWGILTMLGEDATKPGELTKEQLNSLKNKFRADSKAGKLTVVNNLTSWQKVGLTMVEMQVLESIGNFRGAIADAFNVPPVLLSGSNDRTYKNYGEAEKAIWRNAIQPSLDAYLEGLTRFLAPQFKEEGTHLKADYSNVACLQTNKAETVVWMTQAKSFTKNEIREACGYEMLSDPAMDVIYEGAGTMPLDELGIPPDPNIVESALKALKITDYRK
jgi:HK97 family phage portal protein